MPPSARATASVADRAASLGAVGYVVKRYPRFSETFIVNEILAHERAGLGLEIFALRPTSDTHFQAAISQVRAPVTYLAEELTMADLVSAIGHAGGATGGPPLHAALFRKESTRDAQQALQLARLVKERGITHLHAHFATSATSVARMAAAIADVPFTFTAHAKDIFHESVDRADLARKLRDANGTVTVSDFNLRFLREQYGSDADQTVRIYNGLDLEAFPYRDPSERRPIIAAVGRLVEKKGFTDLIDACALLASRGVSFECRIAGGGELAEALQSRIAAHGLGAVVHMEGPLPMPAVIQLMQRAAVLVAPCIVGEDGNRDGLPTVLLEAMALGVPCISTDVTGIPEVMTDGTTGIMIPQRDPMALANAVERLLGNPAERSRLARAARTLIEERFEIDGNSAQLRALFAHAARRHGMRGEASA